MIHYRLITDFRINVKREKNIIKILAKYIKIEIFSNKTIFAFDRVHL